MTTFTTIVMRQLQTLKQFITQPLPDPQKQAEYRHALARLATCVLVTTVLAIFAYMDWVPAVSVLLGLSYLLFALAWSVITKRYPGEISLRHSTTLISDIGMVSVFMYLLAENGALFFCLYLAIISSYTTRLGEKYLYISTGLSTSAMITVMFNVPFWSHNPGLSVGLCLCLLAAPLLYKGLLQQNNHVTAQLQRELQKVTYAATHDATTDLANRFYFFQRVKEEIQRAERYQKKFTVLYIDLDGFEQINSQFGHLFGDEALKVVADRLSSLIRKSDLIARLGGDEFALLLYDLYRTEDIRIFSEKLIEHLSLPITIRRQEAFITASIGISQYPNHGQDPDILINKADQAMHQSKDNGKNGYTFFLEEVGR